MEAGGSGNKITMYKNYINPFKSGGKLHWMKNLYGRYRYGAGCCDRFNLDSYLSKKIIRPLKAFRNGNLASYPMDFASVEEWEKALDEMIFAFEYLNADEFPPDEPAETYQKRSFEMAEREQRGLELFGKHFRSLWI